MMIFGNTTNTTCRFSFKQYCLFYTVQKHGDKVYICIKFVSVVYEIMCNTCVTLIHFFILYIYVQVEICYNVAHLSVM